METRDVLERVEEAEAIAQRQERFARRAAVLVSAMAALLAIASLSASRAATEAILAQQKASDTYNEYQANSLKRHLNENTAALLRLLAAGSPSEAAAAQQAGQLEQAIAQKYRPNQDRLLPQAQALEHERDMAERRHRTFELAEAAFQLGIVLASIAIVARAPVLLWLGGLLGLGGVMMIVEGFLLALPLSAPGHG